MDELKKIKKHIKDKDEDEKKFIKKAVTQITLLGISAHLIYYLYNNLGLVKNMDKALVHQTRTITKGITVGQLPDVSTRIDSGIFSFNTKVSLHEHSNNEGDVLQIPEYSNLTRDDLRVLNYSKYTINHIEIHDPNVEVVLFLGGVSIGSIKLDNFKGPSFIFWWKDGIIEKRKVIKDGEIIERDVSVIKLNDKWRYINDKMGSVIVREKSAFRVIMWDEDDAHNSEWIASFGGADGYGDYDLARLQSMGFQNDSMQRIRVDGDADVELFKDFFNGPSMLLYEDCGEINLNNMRRDGQTYPTRRITTMKVYPKNHFYAYVMLYEEDPGDDHPRMGPLTTKGMFNIGGNMHDDTNWVVINRAPNGIRVFKDSNGGGRNQFLGTPDYNNTMGHHELSAYDLKNEISSIEIL